MEIVLSIAGSDPSAGAGIQQDLKTITALGCYGATAITALTVQNTMGVSKVTAVQPESVASQIRAVADDLNISAVKIGMIPDSKVAESIVAELHRIVALRHVPIVCDPVMVSTSGHRLMQDECIDYVGRHLFPLCSLITPNLHEAQVLAGTTLKSDKDIYTAGRWLAEHYGTAFLIKGGHIESSEEAATDYLFCNDGNNYAFSSARLHARNLHGTGCTLSSAIASLLAKGDVPLPAAVASAKRFVADAIIRSTSHNIGHGSGPLLTLDPSATERIVQNSLVKWKRMCSKSC